MESDSPHDARPPGDPDLRLGTWARAGQLTGLVVAADKTGVALFQPGDRQLARVPVDEVEPLPAGAVTVTVHVDLPLAHGLGEDTLRRWVASLTDPSVRANARAALSEAGLDEGAALPEVRLDVRPADTSGAVCLCGRRTPAPGGAAVVCSGCGRQAYGAPPTG